MTKFFILDDSNNVIPATEAEWESFPSERRAVARTILGSGPAAVEISTSFSGVHEEDEELELFRTWYFQDADDGVEGDYETWQDAERGHEEVVAKWIALFPEAKRADQKQTEPAED